MKAFLLMADLDGTLIRQGQKTISAGVASVLEPLAAARRLVINSARHPRGVSYALGGRLPFVPTIALNGAALCENRWTQLARVRSLDGRAVEAALSVASAHDVALSIYTADDWWVTRFDEYVQHEASVTGMTPRAFKTPFSESVLKMTAMGLDEYLSKIQVELTVCGAGLRAARSNPRYCEISPAGTSKTSFVPLLLDDLGLTREGVELHYIGDSQNDIECAAYADYAYTFDSAPPEMRELAHDVFAVRTDDDLMNALNGIVSSEGKE